MAVGGEDGEVEAEGCGDEDPVEGVAVDGREFGGFAEERGVESARGALEIVALANGAHPLEGGQGKIEFAVLPLDREFPGNDWRDTRLASVLQGGGGGRG